MPGTFEIVELSWERVILHLDVSVPGDGAASFFLKPVDGHDETLFPVTAESLSASLYRLTMNVTSFHGRRQVPNGTYLLIATRGSDVLHARYPLDRITDLDECSRAFVYNQNRSAYTVTFGVTDDEESPDFLIRTYAFGRAGAKPRGGLRGISSKSRVRWAKTKRSALRGIYRASAATRSTKKKKTILFASEARPSMQGNLKAVHDRMVERHLDEKFEFLYSFRTEQSASRATAFSLARQMGKADIVLIDDYFAILMDLGDPETQKIIQLWHAGSGFKSIGYSRFGQYGSPHLTNPHRLYTYAICGSQHLRDVYAEAFGIERDAVIATGLPRVDVFLREGRADEVLPLFEEAFPAAAGKRKVLLAPTFRGRGARDAHYNYDTFDFAALHAACGDDTVILFRQHHFLQEPAPIPPQYADRLIDVAAFPDTNDLLLISDVLVTDYSSIIYEYALLRRPMIFYAYDLGSYSATRGMHRDYLDVAPGPIATTFDEFLELIAQPDLRTDKTEEFVRENFDYVDTHNSDRVIDWLILGDPSEEGERGEA